ncbi:hypothetical protein D3C79_643350 [compost metagenome]
MLPAHQRFGRQQAPLAQAQLGLVVDQQLPLLDGLAQVVLQLQALKGAGTQVLGVELKAVAAQMLGMLLGHVGLADQRAQVKGGIGQQADAYRSTDHHFMAIQTLRHPQFVQQARGHPYQAGQIVVAIKQHGKLITGQTRHGIGLRHGVGDALGHLFQQLVSQLMSEAFIEQLEAVQVDVQQCQAAAVKPYPLPGIVQAQAEQRAVGQPGQFVVMRQVAQALLRLTACRQVSIEADNIADSAPGITYPVQLQPLRIQVAILARFNQLPLPAPLLLQSLFNGQTVPSRITAAGQFQGVA